MNKKRLAMAEHRVLYGDCESWSHSIIHGHMDVLHETLETLADKDKTMTPSEKRLALNGELDEYQVSPEELSWEAVEGGFNSTTAAT